MGLCAHCGDEFEGRADRGFCRLAHKKAWHRSSAEHRRKVAELTAGRSCANSSCGKSIAGRRPNVRHCDDKCRDQARRARERNARH